MSSHKLSEYPLRTDFSAHTISTVVALFVTIFEFNVCWVRVDGCWAEAEDWWEHCCLHYFSLEHFSLCLVKGLNKLPLFVTFFICLFPQAYFVKAHLHDVDKKFFVTQNTTILCLIIFHLSQSTLKLFFQPAILKYLWSSNRHFVYNT